MLLDNTHSKNSNINDMIMGYQEYFNIYDKNMTSYNLHTFRKTIINIIGKASKIAESKENILEDAISDILKTDFDLEMLAELITFQSSRGIINSAKNSLCKMWYRIVSHFTF